MSGTAYSVYKWSELKEEWVGPDLSRKVIHGENLTVSQIFLRKGAKVVMHNHESEQVTCVMSGRVRFNFSDGSEVTLSGGEVIRIPPSVEHGATALEDTLAIDVFSR